MPITEKLDGSMCEADAEQYLRQRGLKPIARNYRSRFGEIDLIMRHDDTLVFIEVKARANTAFGSPAQWVTRSKQKKIVTTAKEFMRQHNTSSRQNCRFDVVGVVANKASGMNVEWLQNAFYGDE